MNPRARASIDGFVPRNTRKTSARTSSKQPAVRRRSYAPPANNTSASKGWAEKLQMPLIIACAMVGGVLAQNAIAGQLAVLVYGAAALIFGISSRISFILALLSMIATIMLLIFKGDVAMSQNFAIYTFLFLVVGVITLNRELKKEGGRIYSIKKTHN